MLTALRQYLEYSKALDAIETEVIEGFGAQQK
jgi:hypothetical protein